MNLNKYISILLLSSLLFGSDCFAMEEMQKIREEKKTTIRFQIGSTMVLNDIRLKPNVYNSAFLYACEKSGYKDTTSLKPDTDSLPTMSRGAIEGQEEFTKAQSPIEAACYMESDFSEETFEFAEIKPSARTSAEPFTEKQIQQGQVKPKRVVERKIIMGTKNTSAEGWA